MEVELLSNTYTTCAQGHREIKLLSGFSTSVEVENWRAPLICLTDKLGKFTSPTEVDHHWEVKNLLMLCKAVR